MQLKRIIGTIEDLLYLIPNNCYHISTCRSNNNEIPSKGGKKKKGENRPCVQFKQHSKMGSNFWHYFYSEKTKLKYNRKQDGAYISP